MQALFCFVWQFKEQYDIKEKEIDILSYSFMYNSCTKYYINQTPLKSINNLDRFIRRPLEDLPTKAETLLMHESRAFTWKKSKQTQNPKSIEV